jgi:type III secretion system YscI/HrpB-like protein
MTILTSVVLDPVVTRGASLGEAARSAEQVKQRATAFNDALGRQAGVDRNAPAMQANAQAQPTDVVAPQQRVDASTPSERARRALELEGVKDPAKASGGDLILDGLQKLRGTFDARQTKVSALLNSSAADATTLLAMQVEVANYTLMVDVTSKLTGKSTQSFDTLMKGQ